VSAAAARIGDGPGGRLCLRGDLSFGSVPAVWLEVRNRFTGMNANLDIDLREVQRADSAGLALLVECVRAARQTGKSIRFFNMPAQMLAIARVSSLEQILPLHRD
jgi:phospholipid transport system transporter-binding protein